MNTVTVLPDTLYATKAAPVSAIRAYLGGSFNPVHDGHIQMAMAVYNCLLPLANQQQRPLHVSLLPNARSPFKAQTIAPKHRLAMLKLAIQDTPLHLSELELWQNPPVYTIDSVHHLREQYPNDCLIFIMGMDSARSLDRWKNGLQLTDYVHLWVFNRLDKAAKTADNLPDTLSEKLPRALKAHVTHSLEDILLPNCPLWHSKSLKNNTKGRIYIDTRPIAMISSTDIRQQLQAGSLQAMSCPNTQSMAATINTNKRMKYLHPMVYHYIIAHQLYSAAQFR